MQLKNSVLLLSALSTGALAQPAHRRHQQFHEHKRAVGDVVTAVIDGVAVTWANTYSGATAVPEAAGVAAKVAEPAAEAATTAEPSSAAATPTAVASSSSAASEASSAPAAPASNSGSASSYTPFCSGSKNKRATAEEIAYKGDVGTSGSWGCNQLLIDDSLVDSYDYTATFSLADKNTDDWQCVCWNKIGPDGGINGWFGHSAVTFGLSAGSSQSVAFDANTQGGCTCGSGSVPTDGNGEYAGTWVEFDFGNDSNGGWSGTDASALVAQASGMSVQGMQVSHDTCTSTIEEGGSATNAYIKGMEAADGIGCNIPGGKANLKVTVGY